MVLFFKLIKWKFLGFWKHIELFLDRFEINGEEFTLYDLCEMFVTKLRQNDLKEKAGSVAFSFTMATFPSIIFLFTLIPYIPIDGLSVDIMESFKEVLPEGIFNTAESTIMSIVHKQHGGLLSFGFFLALFLATNGVLALMTAFDNSYKRKGKKKRTWVRKRMVALFITMLLVFSFIISIVFLMMGEKILGALASNKLLDNAYLVFFIHVLRYITVLFVFFCGVSFIYRFAPTTPRRWRMFSVGAVVATCLSMLLVVGFNYYVNHFTNYNAVYGSIGAMVGYMLWLFLLSQVLLVGFEMNSTIEDLKIKRANGEVW